MKRHSDWRARLKKHIRAASDKPFAYGKHDCALFAAGAVKAMTGVDVARGLRGYRTERAGFKKVRAKGFEDHVGPFAKAMDEIPMRAAGHGDVAVIAGPLGHTIGIVEGRYIVAASASFGVCHVPRNEGIRFFKVGA